MQRPTRAPAEKRSGFAQNPGNLINRNPVELGDLATDMPYFTQVRMRTNCDAGIVGTGAGSGSIGALTAAPGADVGFEVSKMRTTRTACPAVGTGRAGGSGQFDPNYTMVDDTLEQIGAKTRPWSNAIL